jgi:lipopolysaccharide export system protein LptA
MKLPFRANGPAGALAAALICSGAVGATSAEKPASASDSVAIFPGTNSKEPISIDADKLVYYDKEHKAIYSGSVVVIQGDTKMTCTVMTVFLDRSPAQGQSQAPAPAQGQSQAAAPALGQSQAAAPAQGPNQAKNGQSAPTGDSGVKHLDATGPVTVISKTQVATGDSASYDKAEDKVWLIGHVTLSDGQNVTKGDKLTYDLKTGQATIDPGAKSGRVHGQFIQNSGADAAKAK